MKFLSLLTVFFIFYNFGGSSSSSCGELHNITYPFYLPGTCKWKVYELQCDGNNTVLYIGATKYLVKDMSIKNRTLTLVDPDLAVGGCRLPKQILPWISPNIYTWYNFFTQEVDRIYFFNCTEEVEDSMYKLINCMDGTHSRVYATYTFSYAGSIPKSCRFAGGTIVTNFDWENHWNEIDGVHLMQMLRRGFVVSWYMRGYLLPGNDYITCSLLQYCWKR